MKVAAKKSAKPVDLRVARTRAQIDAAFVAMLHRRSYDGIRVGDITRKAGVGRATFYAHYATKHDLLQSQLRRIVCPMITPTTHGDCPVDATALFKHLADSPLIYRGLMAGVSGPAVQRMLLTCFEERLQQLLADSFSNDEHLPTIPRALVERFIASSLLTLASWTVEFPGERTAGETQTIYATLIGGGTR